MNPSADAIGVFTTDRDLIVRTWDEALAGMCGISAAQARGRPLQSLLPDLAERGLLERMTRALEQGTVEVLAPAFHHHLIPCPPRAPSRCEHMRQRVTLAPLRKGAQVVGLMVTVEDVTRRYESEAGNDFIEQIEDADWRARRAAVQARTDDDDPRLALALLRALREEHRDFGILSATLQMLATCSASLTEPLCDLLCDEDPALRTQAALALGERGDAGAASALVRALADPDTNVRYHVIEALGKLRVNEAASPLAALAAAGAREDHFFLAYAALDALARIGNPEVATRLLPLLGDPLLAAPAAEALGEIGDASMVGPLSALLRQSTTVVPACHALYRLDRRFDDDALAPIPALALEAIDANGEAHLAQQLESADDASLPALIAVSGWLQGKATGRALARLLRRSAVRSDVQDALQRRAREANERELRIEAPIDELIEALHADDTETRQAAACALGKYKDPRAVPALLPLLTASAPLAIAVAGALTELADPRAFEPLMASLADPDAAVRQAAIGALHRLGHPDMQARVIAMLDHVDAHLRESAVHIAGYFGYAGCMERLRAACQDSVEQVRRAAIEQLPHIAPAQAIEPLLHALALDTPLVRAAAARGLGRLGDARAGRRLVAALGDPDSWVRYYAARALGELGATEAVAALAQAAKTDRAPYVRIAAIEALRCCGDPAAAAALASLVQEGDEELAGIASRARAQSAAQVEGDDG